MAAQVLDIAGALEHARTQHGRSLLEMNRSTPLLVAFLRHLGCPFCRETLADLAVTRSDVEEAGARIVLIHMAAEHAVGSFFARYGLQDVARVSDPNQWLYRAFHLRRAGPMALLAPRVVRRTLEAMGAGHTVGLPIGDPLQMPGIFLVYREEIVQEYRHKTAGDRPNYLRLLSNVRVPSPS